LTAPAYDFRQVSVTAFVVAYARGLYTDIPLAKEMFAVLRDRGATLSGTPWSEQKGREFAPFVDARFRAVSRLIQEKDATQVLELAAGLSPRGMDLAQRGMVYVEADLPDSTVMKREIVTAILGSVPANLHLCPASVVDRAQLLACCSPFDAARPLAIATEGLLRYLTFDEKAQLAANVHEILSRYGGWWITPDIHLRKWMVARQTPAHRESESATLGRDLDPNYFDDLDHAHAFFEGNGFTVDSRPLLAGLEGQVALPEKEDRMAELNERRVFIVTPRH